MVIYSALMLVWGVGGGGDFSSLLPVQTGTGVHSTSYKMSTGEFLRG